MSVVYLVTLKEEQNLSYLSKLSWQLLLGFDK